MTKIWSLLASLFFDAGDPLVAVDRAIGAGVFFQNKKVPLYVEHIELLLRGQVVLHEVLTAATESNVNLTH